MRVLGSAVLAMEIFIMGFALLLVKDSDGKLPIFYGIAFIVLIIIAIRALKSPAGWIMGSVLQLALIAFSVVVTALWFIALIFIALWISAYIVGKKGEAARAALMATRTPDAQ